MTYSKFDRFSFSYYYHESIIQQSESNQKQRQSVIRGSEPEPGATPTNTNSAFLRAVILLVAEINAERIQTVYRFTIILKTVLYYRKNYLYLNIMFNWTTFQLYPGPRSIIQ